MFTCTSRTHTMCADAGVLASSKLPSFDQSVGANINKRFGVAEGALDIVSI
jgi:hypothetical protein